MYKVNGSWKWPCRQQESRKQLGEKWAAERRKTIDDGKEGEELGAEQVGVVSEEEGEEEEEKVALGTECLCKKISNICCA